MKFHLLRCELHGWMLKEAEPPLRPEEKKNLECLGHMLTTDTRTLPIYDADPNDIRNVSANAYDQNAGLTDEQKQVLLKKSKLIGSNQDTA